MATTIIENGIIQSSIDDLLEKLESNILDPEYEAHGLFCGRFSPTELYFYGDFYDISWPFRIITDDDSLALDLEMAVEDNLEAPEYLDAKRRFYPEIEAWEDAAKGVELDFTRIFPRSSMDLVESAIRSMDWPFGTGFFHDQVCLVKREADKYLRLTTEGCAWHVIYGGAKGCSL